MQSLKAAIQNTPLDFSKTYPLSVLNIGQDVGLTPWMQYAVCGQAEKSNPKKYTCSLYPK